MSVLTIGAPPPAFNLLDQDGTPVAPEQFLGQWLVVYFYPKAATPGCTVQACGLRDSFEQWSSLGVQVVGISTDLPAKLKKFSLAHHLPFRLLSDPTHETAEHYGVWALKKFMGKTFFGVVRTTFVIDPNGVLAAILGDFKTSTHQDILLAQIKQLQSSFE
ncbi:MAG: thiol peroxidase [Pseudomonadota bacterium]|jgi:thioredoxin-dependent peroxiredoxin